MTLFLLPIEPYVDRYSGQWWRWFPDRLTARGIEHVVVAGDWRAGTLGATEVLSHLESTRHRLQQVDRLLSLLEQSQLRDGDSVLMATSWWPGLEALAYVRDCLGLDLRITAVLHTGAYDAHDFRVRQGMDAWSGPLERSWMAMIDRVVVSTRWHRDQAAAFYELPDDRFEVVPLPIDLSQLRTHRSRQTREDLIIFPHRLVPEKGPGIVTELRAAFPDAEVAITREVCATQKDFYELAGRAKVAVSASLQETYGYSMIEAAALGAVPVVPDRLVYRELFPDRFRYASTQQLLEQVGQALSRWADPAPALTGLLQDADHAVDRIIDAALR